MILICITHSFVFTTRQSCLRPTENILWFVCLNSIEDSVHGARGCKRKFWLVLTNRIVFFVRCLFKPDQMSVRRDFPKSICVFDLYEKNSFWILLFSLTRPPDHSYSEEYESGSYLRNPFVDSRSRRLRSLLWMLVSLSDLLLCLLGPSTMSWIVLRISSYLAYMKLSKVSFLFQYVRMRGAYRMHVIQKIMNPLIFKILP